MLLHACKTSQISATVCFFPFLQWLCSKIFFCNKKKKNYKVQYGRRNFLSALYRSSLIRCATIKFLSKYVCVNVITRQYLSVCTEERTKIVRSFWVKSLASRKERERERLPLIVLMYECVFGGNTLTCINQYTNKHEQKCQTQTENERTTVWAKKTEQWVRRERNGAWHITSCSTLLTSSIETMLNLFWFELIHKFHLPTTLFYWISMC